MLCSANCLSKLLSSLITVESYIRASVVHSRLYEAMLLSGFHTACFCRYKKLRTRSIWSLCAERMVSACGVCCLYVRRMWLLCVKSVVLCVQSVGRDGSYRLDVFSLIVPWR